MWKWAEAAVGILIYFLLVQNGDFMPVSSFPATRVWATTRGERQSCSGLCLETFKTHLRRRGMHSVALQIFNYPRYSVPIREGTFCEGKTLLLPAASFSPVSNKSPSLGSSWRGLSPPRCIIIPPALQQRWTLGHWLH